MSEKKHKVKTKALEILENYPNGIRARDLIQQLYDAFPDISKNTILSCVWDLVKDFPDKVYKPSRGLYKLTKYRDFEIKEVKEVKVKEEDFYQPFADWLVNEIEEATKAIPLGGNRFKDKWGTPDVIGIREPKKSDIIKTTTEVISAEIKSNTSELITAFGQACAYNLFSHKVYLIIPKQSSEEDIARLDSLCLIFGIGLVLFDAQNPDDPKFEIRVRPIKREPDIFYANKYLKMIENELFD